MMPWHHEFRQPRALESHGRLRAGCVNAQARNAFDQGINFIDTANVYSLGQSELRVGQALKDVGLPRDELVVATKASRGQSRIHLIEQTVFPGHPASHRSL
ncbi:MAG: aldo/keto reductase [Betaproteobacteria bacterium]|nr:aldo/keto reductase [Betaproteobacteria bacterium]